MQLRKKLRARVFTTPPLNRRHFRVVPRNTRVLIISFPPNPSVGINPKIQYFPSDYLLPHIFHFYLLPRSVPLRLLGFVPLFVAFFSLSLSFSPLYFTLLAVSHSSYALSYFASYYLALLYFPFGPACFVPLCCSSWPFPLRIFDVASFSLPPLPPLSLFLYMLLYQPRCLSLCSSLCPALFHPMLLYSAFFTPPSPRVTGLLSIFLARSFSFASHPFGQRMSVTLIDFIYSVSASSCRARLMLCITSLRFTSIRATASRIPHKSHLLLGPVYFVLLCFPPAFSPRDVRAPLRSFLRRFTLPRCVSCHSLHFPLFLRFALSRVNPRLWRNPSRIDGAM